MQDTYKTQALGHLKKAEGMLKKVISLIEADAYCIDVLQQSLATLGFLKSANRVILENHLNACFKEGMSKAGPQRQKKLIAELLRIVKQA